MAISTDTRTAFRCGYIGLCGRPNVGKSTLLNRLVGQKLSITSAKPHTTRWHLLGVKTAAHCQLIYVDMPGVSRQRGNAINRFMRREVAEGLAFINVALLLVEATRWLPEDELVLEQLKTLAVPLLAVVNKIDKVKDKTRLLPFIESLGDKHDFGAIIPVSAQTGEQIGLIEAELEQRLPEHPPIFPDDQLSDRNERFFMAELLREQLMRHLGDELPYCLTVVIEAMHEEANITHIHALIWVESDGQKAIIIGHGGSRLKQIASTARRSMEQFLGTRVNLKTWVKVRADWTNDTRSLSEFGYEH